MLQDDDNKSSPHEWDTSELCSDKSNGTHICYGHNAYDVTFFRSTHQLSNGSYTQTHLSNWEVRQSQMVKGNYGLSYLYNHFDFEHCKDVFNITFKAVHDSEYVHSTQMDTHFRHCSRAIAHLHSNS